MPSQPSWEEEARRALEKWRRMSEEARLEYLRAVLRSLRDTARRSPAHAAAAFIKWLASPEGAVAWPHIWRPEYRPLMVRLGYELVRLAYWLLGGGGQRPTQPRRGAPYSQG